MAHVRIIKPIIGGIVFGIILVISSLTFLKITGILAREILATSVSGIISLCYVISIGSIYILLIILHLLSVRVPGEANFQHKHYHSLLNIAKLATVIIIFSIMIILILNIPFTLLDLPDSMYSKIYYIILAASAILGGSFISIITIIYQTIRMMIYHKEEQLSLNLNLVIKHETPENTSEEKEEER